MKRTLALSAIALLALAACGDDAKDNPPQEDASVVEGDEFLPIERSEAGPGAGTDGGADDDASRMSVRQRKLVLRDANADVARELVRATGWSHPQVNAELNRLAGIRRISEATLEQLERRLAEGRRWLRST